MWLMGLQSIWVWCPGRGNADRKVVFFLVLALGRSLVLPSRPCSASHRACPCLVTGQDPAAKLGTVSVETGAVPAFSPGRAGGLAAGASGR